MLSKPCVVKAYLTEVGRRTTVSTRDHSGRRDRAQGADVRAELLHPNERKQNLCAALALSTGTGTVHLMSIRYACTAKDPGDEPIYN